MDQIFTSTNLVSLLTLTFLEIVLGIDNIIFISIVTHRLPKNLQAKGRSIGLMCALVFRIILLSFISWLAHWKQPLFYVGEFGVSGRDLILLAGGLFLIGKSVSEIHQKLEGDPMVTKDGKRVTLGQVIFQIIIIDIVFSFDSILTAVGLVNNVPIMITAVVISMFIMLLFSGYISEFINRHPTIKILALSFLIMIGMMLVAESLHQEVPKGYAYFAMFFGLAVEMINMRVRPSSSKPVDLVDTFDEESKYVGKDFNEEEGK
ncbi:MAG: TerC family protein [Sphingobacteriales bacterium]|nr:TerC family protein [Sphingobacteriales bacterium]